MTKQQRRKSTSGDDGVAGSFGGDIGGLFSGLGDFVEMVGKLAEAGERHIERHGEFPIEGLGDKARGVYGFSIRTAVGGGKPHVESFGNVHAGDEGLVVDDIREPLVDVFDEGDEVVITGELPGVSEKDIAVRLEGDMVTIETHGERRFAKEVLLPGPVDAESVRQSYNNGVLEIRATKQGTKTKSRTRKKGDPRSSR